MTTTTQPPANAVLEHLAPSAIDTDEAFNPRTRMNDAKLAEITNSVANVGVIQPVIVTRTNDSRRYRLVVGHRRLTAAQTAKLQAIPALVYDAIDDPARLQLAIIENLQREDINPIDEARSFERAVTQHDLTQKQLAEAVGKSTSHVSERLRLLKLPPGCQQQIASGTLPLTAVKALAQIAKVAPAVADGCARLVAEGAADINDLVSEPHFVVCQLADVEWDNAPFVQPADRYSRSTPIRLSGHIPDDEIAALSARAEALGHARFSFDSDDLDAARAYKCLLEFGEGYASHRFVTDPRFTFDRITLALDHTEAERTKELAQQNPDEPDTPEPADVGDSIARAQRLEAQRKAREQAERKLQREQADTARLNAIAANRQLGLSLVQKVGSKKLDRDTAELLALIVLAQNQQLAGRGIRYTHDEFHTVERIRSKSGITRTKFVAADSTAATDKLEAWVLRPKLPEEILGRLVQALIAGTIADHHAVAQSQRVHWHLPSRIGSRRAEQIIAKLAAKIAPQHFQDTITHLLPKPASTAKREPTPPAATTNSPAARARTAKTPAPKSKRPAKARATAKATPKGSATTGGTRTRKVASNAH